MLHKILVALDHSDSNRSLFQYALDLAQQTGASLMLLHCIALDERRNPPLPTAFAPYYYPIVTDEMANWYQKQWEAAETQGLDMLRSFAEIAIAHEVTTEFTQSIGEPGRVICSIARGSGADLILVGRRGLTGLNEWFLGSVSNYVLHHAHCAVLAVPSTSLVQPSEDEQTKFVTTEPNHPSDQARSIMEVSQ